MPPLIQDALRNLNVLCGLVLGKTASAVIQSG